MREVRSCNCIEPSLSNLKLWKQTTKEVRRYRLNSNPLDQFITYQIYSRIKNILYNGFYLVKNPKEKCKLTNTRWNYFIWFH